MRKTLPVALAMALIPTYAAAQTGGSGFYGEVGAGLSLIQNAASEPFSIPAGSVTLAGTLNTEYASPQGTAGGELGFATGRWRFGVSYDWMGAPVERAAFSGTLNGTPVNLVIQKGDLDVLGIDSEGSFMIAGGNLYYSFAPTRSAVEPYVGLGVGSAFVENASSELALSAMAGARFAISPRAYVGARYRFTHIAGPKDDSGITYKSIMIHTVSVQLGLYLGSF